MAGWRFINHRFCSMLFQCLISSIPVSTFATLTSLVTLYVGTPYQVLCSVLFYLLWLTNHSDLSVNMITALPLGLFNSQSQLNALYGINVNMRCYIYVQRDAYCHMLCLRPVIHANAAPRFQVSWWKSNNNHSRQHIFCSGEFDQHCVSTIEIFESSLQ